MRSFLRLACLEALQAAHSECIVVPTLYPPQLNDSTPSWLHIWDRMYAGLRPDAFRILAILEFYSERGLTEPDINNHRELTSEEDQRIGEIASALAIAADVGGAMPNGELIATLRALAKDPLQYDPDALPAAVQWELAQDYRRDGEKPGTYPLDIWGSEQVKGPMEKPSPANIARAAQLAAKRIQAGRERGRRLNRATPVVAECLSKIFRSSGKAIVRHSEKEVRHRKMVRVEAGPFYDFLELVLKPLQLYLRERKLPPVTIESVVRIVTS